MLWIKNVPSTFFKTRIFYDLSNRHFSFSIRSAVIYIDISTLCRNRKLELVVHSIIAYVCNLIAGWRIFASWTIIYFRQLFESYRSSWKSGFGLFSQKNITVKLHKRWIGLCFWWFFHKIICLPFQIPSYRHTYVTQSLGSLSLRKFLT
jgi:hypothetical protein